MEVPLYLKRSYGPRILSAEADQLYHAAKRAFNREFAETMAVAALDLYSKSAEGLLDSNAKQLIYGAMREIGERWDLVKNGDRMPSGAVRCLRTWNPPDVTLNIQEWPIKCKEMDLRQAREKRDKLLQLKVIKERKESDTADRVMVAILYLEFQYVLLSVEVGDLKPLKETLDALKSETLAVWIVSNEQLLAWVQNPVPISQLDTVSALKCSTPQVDSSLKICNGIPQNENGLLSHCDFSDFPFYTCYGCPQTEPTPDNPNPAQQIPDGQQARYRLPSNCSTPFWDPIAGKCICTSSTCAFIDNSRPIGANGANLTGGGTGGSFENDTSASATAYIPFNNGELPTLPQGVWHTVFLAGVGALLGSLSLFARL
ncbi:hypothetical protein H0H93_005494 [Arthromyces matolae]|nr:hypothetical protein H0H93_005494 [Arthromyces matolae]